MEVSWRSHGGLMEVFAGRWEVAASLEATYIRAAARLHAQKAFHSEPRWPLSTDTTRSPRHRSVMKQYWVPPLPPS